VCSLALRREAACSAHASRIKRRYVIREDRGAVNLQRKRKQKNQVGERGGKAKGIFKRCRTVMAVDLEDKKPRDCMDVLKVTQEKPGKNKRIKSKKNS